MEHYESTGNHSDAAIVQCDEIGEYLDEQWTTVMQQWSSVIKQGPSVMGE